MNSIRRKETWLAIGGGVLATFALPGFGAAPLIFVALIPLFFALERGRGFLHGYLFGIAFFAIDVRWVLTLIRFNPLVIPGYVLLVAYLALPLGLVGWLMTRQPGSRAALTWILLAPAIFVLAEALRTLGPLGMGFAMLHQALYRVPWLIQSASIFGSWSVTAFIVAINAVWYTAIREKRVGFAILGFALLLVQGAFSLLPAEPSENAPSLDVAIVSSNVAQEIKLNTAYLEAFTDRYLQLGEEAIATDPDLVVFPESFLPTYILRDDEIFDRLANLAIRGETELLFGTGTYRDGQIYNSVALVDTDGRVLDTYDMVRPVPFGEYIPGRRLLEAIGLGPWARSFLPVDLSPGSDYNSLDRFGTPICFESTFPTASRRLTANGASLLAVVTNDAWFVGSSELKSHFATAVFRAVENRRSVVQAANGGLSGFVDPRGFIRGTTTEETVSTGSVRLSNARSIYTRWGDGPLLVLMGCVVAGCLGLRILRRVKQPGS